MYVFKWTASSEFGTYSLCEQRRFRRACASAQSRQNLRCSLIKAVSQEEPSDRKPDPWPRWMAGHAQLKFVMTECSKTQIRLTGPKWCTWCYMYISSHTYMYNICIKFRTWMLWWWLLSTLIKVKEWTLPTMLRIKWLFQEGLRMICCKVEDYIQVGNHM